MTEHIPFDAQDRLALQKLDEDFIVNPDGTAASITGVMTVKVVRIAQEGGDRWLMTLYFPSGEPFDAQFLRVRVLEQIGIKVEPNG